jgi:AraC family transcriptional regulator
MFSRIETIPAKQLAGKHTRMSFSNNRTFELWHSFMPHRKEIKNSVGDDLYSIEVYNNPLFFNNFDPMAAFEKWAAIEIEDISSVPDQMESIIIPAGLYAVFTHKGPAGEGLKTYQYIFKDWLPESEYAVDNRPHFAVMGEKYKGDDVNSEEEIWIPIKRKKAYSDKL